MEIKGIEIYNSVKEAFAKHPDAILIPTQIGNCMVCGNRHDLRAGACFACCSKVSGEPIKGGHRLWETDNPTNIWYVGESLPRHRYRS